MRVDELPRIVRVAPMTVVIFAVILSPALLVAMLLFWDGQQVPDGVVLCVLYVALLYWMCGRTVELAAGRLVYLVFFTRKDIDLSKVVAVSIVARPAPTLEIRCLGSRQPVPAFIVKPFSRSGVAAILQHIRECNPGVELDRVAQDMSQGRFDTIMRESMKTMHLLRLVLLVVGVLMVAALARVRVPRIV